MTEADDVGEPVQDVLRCVTIREVMAIYRIGRCTAYDQAAMYLRDGPGHGIPCLRMGTAIRFPVAWIEAHIGRPVDKDLP